MKTKCTREGALEADLRRRRVFVTGATGTLGRRVARLLAGSGREVVALARSEEAMAALRRRGATAVRSSLFDAGRLQEAISGCDAVLHLASRIPGGRRALRRSAWRENDEIRSRGTRILVDAALAAGVRTLVYPSACFLYPDAADAWVDCTVPPDCPELLRSSMEAEDEVARFARAGGRGIVLRMGYFYGPDAPNTLEALDLARRGLSPVPGRSGAFLPVIWVDDAARAVVAALERAPAGVHDVVDDDPRPRGEHTRLIAPLVGRRRLLALPSWLARLFLGPTARFLLRSQRVSNRPFKRATGWEPRIPSAREGWPRIDETLRALT